MYSSRRASLTASPVVSTMRARGSFAPRSRALLRNRRTKLGTPQMIVASAATSMASSRDLRTGYSGCAPPVSALTTGRPMISAERTQQRNPPRGMGESG